MGMGRGAFAASAALFAAVLASPSASSIQVAPVLPPPTGPMAIGTISWRLTDDSRRETWVGSDAFREVPVVAWYPAVKPATSRTRAPYLREGLGEVRALASRLGGPNTFNALESLQAHGMLDAPPATTPAKLPLLVFSHGYIGIPSSHTALLEELASHGYVVLSINHPYDSSAATLSDGRTVSFLDDSGTPRPHMLRVIDEWKQEDETMTAVTRATDVGEQRRLLGDYLKRLPQTHETLRRWVDDTRLVLDRLAALPSGTPAARLAARVDMNAVGVFGHSMGGVTAGQFCLDDRRCRAGLNLDGIPQYGSMIDGKLDRPFLMVYSARPGRAGASDPIYRRAAAPYHRVDVAHTLHLDFGDMGFWGRVVRERGLLGPMPSERALEITRAVVREYFDQVLRGRPSSLLSGKPVFPEVSVQTFESPR